MSDAKDSAVREGTDQADDDFLADLDSILADVGEAGDVEAAAAKDADEATDLDELESFLDEFEKTLESEDSAGGGAQTEAADDSADASAGDDLDALFDEAGDEAGEPSVGEPASQAASAADEDDLDALFGDSATDDATADTAEGDDDLDALFDAGESAEAGGADESAGDDDLDALFAEDAGTADADGQTDDSGDDLDALFAEEGGQPDGAAEAAEGLEQLFDEEPGDQDTGDADLDDLFADAEELGEPADQRQSGVLDDLDADDLELSGDGGDQLEELHILDSDGSGEAPQPSKKPAEAAAPADDAPFLDELAVDEFEPAAEPARAAEPRSAAPAPEKPAAEPAAAAATAASAAAPAAPPAKAGGPLLYGALALGLLGLLGAGGAGFLALGLSDRIDSLNGAVEGVQAEVAPVVAQAGQISADDLVRLERRVEELSAMTQEPVARLRADNERSFGELAERVSELDAAIFELRRAVDEAAAKAQAAEKAATARPAPAKPAVAKATPTPAPKPEPKAEWAVNLASLSSADAAAEELQRLRDAGIDAEQQRFSLGGRVWYRLRVTGFDDYDAAKAYAEKAKQRAGLTSAWVDQL